MMTWFAMLIIPPFERIIDLEKVEYLILNEIEASDILGAACTDEDELVEKLTKRFPNTKIVLTLGENGSVYVDKTQKIRQEIYKADVVDTTAAGDTFTGYFMAGGGAGVIKKNKKPLLKGFVYLGD